MGIAVAAKETFDLKRTFDLTCAGIQLANMNHRETMFDYQDIHLFQLLTKSLQCRMPQC